MNKYRFILGKKVDTSVNLVTNGTFTGSATGWTLGTGWSYSSNEVRNNGSSTGTLKQSNVVTPGQTYYLSYDMQIQSGTTGVRVTPSIGGTYYDVINGYDECLTAAFETFVHENVFCGQGNDLLFDPSHNTGSTDDLAIDNVLLYAYVWNDPLTYDPLDWDKAKITKKRDTVLNGLITEYIMGLTFVEDGYDYIYDKFLTDGFCADIPVRIECWNSVAGIYELFFEGIIYMNNCQFDITERTVKVNIEDTAGALLLEKNKDVKVGLFPEYWDDALIPGVSGLVFPLTGPSPFHIFRINDDSGNYCTTSGGSGALVYNLLRKIILVATNYRLDFDSVYFGTGGTQQGLFVSWGQNIRKITYVYPETQHFNKQLSLNELFTELNKLFNLTFSIDKSGPVPKVFIEPKVDYLNATPVLELDYVNDVKVTFDNANIVKCVNIGYEYVDPSPGTVGLNTPEGVQFATSNLCASKTLNLVSKFIQDSLVIKEMQNATINTNKYDNYFVWIETDLTPTTACSFPAYYQTLNSGSGTYDINPNIDADDNMGRHIQTLQTNYLKTIRGENISIEKSNAALANIFNFKYPLTKVQFDSMQQALDSITFTRDGTGFTEKTGYLIEAVFEIHNGLTEFKILTS